MSRVTVDMTGKLKPSSQFKLTDGTSVMATFDVTDNICTIWCYMKNGDNPIFLMTHTNYAAKSEISDICDLKSYPDHMRDDAIKALPHDLKVSIGVRDVMNFQKGIYGELSTPLGQSWHIPVWFAIAGSPRLEYLRRFLEIDPRLEGIIAGLMPTDA